MSGKGEGGLRTEGGDEDMGGGVRGVERLQILILNYNLEDSTVVSLTSTSPSLFSCQIYSQELILIMV